MDALVQFFTTFATALVATVLGHIGVAVERFDIQLADGGDRRVIQRSHTPDRPHSAASDAL